MADTFLPYFMCSCCGSICYAVREWTNEREIACALKLLCSRLGIIWKQNKQSIRPILLSFQPTPDTPCDLFSIESASSSASHHLVGVDTGLMESRSDPFHSLEQSISLLGCRLLSSARSVASSGWLDVLVSSHIVEHGLSIRSTIDQSVDKYIFIRNQCKYLHVYSSAWNWFDTMTVDSPPLLTLFPICVRLNCSLIMSQLNRGRRGALFNRLLRWV